MNISKVNINTLKYAEYNPRIKLKPGMVEYERLKRSIQEFGYVEPIIVNDRTGLIVGGHQRLTVLKDLGYEEVDVVHVDLDSEHEKALNIALNKISGDWDAEKLEDLLRDIDLNTNLDIEFTGFSMDEINTLFGKVDLPSDLDDYFRDLNEKEEAKKEEKNKLYIHIGKDIKIEISADEYTSIKEQYKSNDNKYGGYSYNITKTDDTVISEVTIDYTKMDIEKFIEDNEAVKAYVNDDNQLTVEGVKKMYKSIGATCK